MDHTRTAVVTRITDYSMSGARRGPDGRFVRVEGLRERLARPRIRPMPVPEPDDENVAYVAPALIRVG
jgi:hypothetical protein